MKVKKDIVEVLTQSISVNFYQDVWGILTKCEIDIFDEIYSDSHMFQNKLNNFNNNLSINLLF